GGVGGVDLHAVAGLRDAVQLEARGEVLTVAVPVQAGQAEPAGRVLRHDRDREIGVEAAALLDRAGAAPQFEQSVPGQPAEVRTPVQDGREAWTGAVQHEADATGPELQNL